MPEGFPFFGFGRRLGLLLDGSGCHDFTLPAIGCADSAFDFGISKES